MKLPKISIITPSLNQSAYIERCIQSVLDQEYSDIEHIVVDGASQDDTLEVVERFSHLRVLLEPEANQTQALNKGFAVAEGQVLGWLNCDDELKPGVLHEVGQAALETNFECIIMGMVELIHAGTFMRIQRNQKRSFFRYLNPWIPYTIFGQPGIFFPRELLLGLGPLDEKLEYAMDYDLFCCALKSNIPFVRLERVVARSNIHGEGKTGKGWSVLYPEQDRVGRYHAGALPCCQRFLYQGSYYILRPCLRALSRALLPPIY